MCHTRGSCSAMPVFLPWLDPDNIALPDFLYLTAQLLNPPGASRNDQSLAQRMGVPCCPSARLERDTGTGHACGIWGLEERVDTHCAGEPVGGSFAGRL